MKKVGIITFHCSYNYGSMLQAYALQQYIKELGFDVSIIDFVSVIDFEQYRLFRTNLYKKNKKAIIADFIFLFSRLKRKNEFERFKKDRLNLTRMTYYDCDELKELNDYFDIFVCGSDQIWNIDCTCGIEPAFFLKFVNDDKVKIAYAPSLAHVKFSIDRKVELKSLIERIDFVSVREESTIPYLSSFCDKDITVALDPTLLLGCTDYFRLMTDSKKREKYIFVYYLEINKDLISYCDTLHRETGYEVYYISSKVNCGMHCGKNMYGIGPEEFLDYIKNAEYVITNSFHATVFSILFEKKFCTFLSGASSSRMTDLLNKLGLQNRVFSDEFSIDENISYKSVLEKLEVYKEDSCSFLKRALKVDAENE